MRMAKNKGSCLALPYITESSNTFPACWQGRYGNSEVIYGWRQQNPHPERQVAAVSFRLADAAGDVGYVIQSLQIFPSGD